MSFPFLVITNKGKNKLLLGFSLVAIYKEIKIMEKKNYTKPNIDIVLIEDVILTSVTVTEYDGTNIDRIQF